MSVLSGQRAEEGSSMSGRKDVSLVWAKQMPRGQIWRSPERIFSTDKGDGHLILRKGVGTDRGKSV